MDFLPASGYEGGRGGAPAWWPTLVDAILSVAYAKPVAVRLLVSKWAHTSSSQPLAMRRLAEARGHLLEGGGDLQGVLAPFELAWAGDQRQRQVIGEADAADLDDGAGCLDLRHAGRSSPRGGSAKARACGPAGRR